MQVKIGMVQIGSHGSNAEAIKSASRMLKRLGGNETDLVCMPEQWLKENRIGDFDSEFSWLGKIAREYGMTVVAGAFYHKRGRDLVITSPVIGPSGEIVGMQDKIHPFGLEKDLISGGTRTTIFRTRCRFGILVCYDMVFSDVAESLARKGAQVLLSPSRIVRPGITPWHMYVQVRALENRIPIVAANVQNRRFGGKSIIVDLVERSGVVLPRKTILSRQAAKSVVFDLSKYQEARKERHSDHRVFT